MDAKIDLDTIEMLAARVKKDVKDMVKVKSIREGVTIQELINKWAKEYIKKEEKIGMGDQV